MNLETLFAPLGLRVNLSALTADPTKMLFRSISDRPKSGTTKKQPSIKYVSVRLHAQNAWGRAIPSPSSGPITFTYLWLLRIVLAKLMRTITRLVGLNRRKLNICTYVHATDTFSFVPHPCK